MHVFLMIVAALAIPGLAIGQSRGDPWVSDLKVLADELPKRHVDPFKWTPPERLKGEFARLEDEIGQVDVRSKPIKVAEFVASLRDGHSFVEGYFPILGFRPKTYPIRLYAFSDGIYIQATSREHARSLGMRVLSINGEPVERALVRVGRMFPAENAMSQKAWAVYGLTSPDVLRAYGLLDASGNARFVLERDGKRREQVFSGDGQAQPEESSGQIVDAGWVTAAAGSKPPLRSTHPELAYWHAFDPSDGTYFVQFNQIRDSGKQGVLAFFDEVVREVATRPVERFVLDLRWNPGGETGMNSDIVRSLLSSPVINRPGKFFVLIGRRTFSSAQLICTALDQYSNAIFVGEPSGIRTHFFANTRKSVVLPNSKLGVYLSTNWWQPTNSRELQPWQRPDVAIEESFADYAGGADPALEAAMRYRPGVQLKALFADALGSDAADWEVTIAQYRSFKGDKRNRYIDTESQVNDVAYALLESGPKEVALRLFEYNAGDYPESANAHDSLAEALEAAGRLRDALRHYQVAVELAVAQGATTVDAHRKGLERVRAKVEHAQ